MSIKIIKPHHYASKLVAGVNGTYDVLFWEIELYTPLTESDEFKKQLFRNDIWEQAHRANRLCYTTGMSSILDATVSIPAEHMSQFVQTAANAGFLFGTRWYQGAEYYSKHAATRTMTQLFKDLPGFDMDIHLDNSHVMLQSIINLTDNDVGTELFSIDSDKPIYTMSGERNRGIMFFNSPGALHRIKNVAKERYILYFGITHG